jgi:hypothetical protein
MIRSPTVLIFGAGVSVEYGFPLGRSLLLSVATQLMDRTALHSSMAACGFPDSLVRQFARNLKDSMQPSIDAFLQTNLEYTDIGKAAIAASLIPLEQMSTITARGAELKLYEYLWRHMAGTPGMYPGNQLSVVTFNYDRSFEQFVRNALFSSHSEFRRDAKDLNRAISHFPVKHVYGSLGDLDNPDVKGHLPYGRSGALDRETILESAARIKLFHENRSGGVEQDPIATLLEEAQVVCFLGFAFHEINVRWLQTYGLGKNSKTKYFGSAFGLKAGEVAAVKKALGLEIEVGHELGGALECLRTFPILM